MESSAWGSEMQPLGSVLGLFFVQSALIIMVTRCLSLTAKIVRQPKVIFEIIGGVVLGPSVFGHYQQYLNTLFPFESIVYLDFIAGIGLVLYLFLVGIELDARKVSLHYQKAWTVASCGSVIPFLVALLTCPTLYVTFIQREEEFRDVQYWTFALFIGTAMSITAFPVLARILNEKAIMQCEVGVIALGAAALEEIISWTMVILAVSIANAGSTLSAAVVLIRVIIFVLLVLYMVKPLYCHLVFLVECKEFSSRSWKYREHLFAFTLVCALLSAWITEVLGVHSIFGSFLFGTIIPRNSRIWRDCTDRIEGVVHVVFLPLYFALSGLKTDISKIDSMGMLLCLIMVVAAACGSKWIACFVPAWLHGLPPRRAAAVAVLMNTRGLMELIVLNLGVDCGVLSVRIFTIMIMMTLITTCMTSPMIDWVLPESEKGGSNSEENVVSELEMNMLKTGGAIDWCDRENNIAILIADESELVGIVNVMCMLCPTIHPYALGITAFTYNEEVLTMTKEKSMSMRMANSMMGNGSGGKRADKGPSAVSEALATVMAAVGARFGVLTADMTRRSIQRSANLYVALQMPKLVIIPWKDSKYMQQTFRTVTAAVPCPIAFLCENGTPVGAPSVAAALGSAIRRIVVLVSGRQSDTYVLSTAQYIAMHHPTTRMYFIICRGITGDENVFDDDVAVMVEKLKYILQAELLPEVSIHDFTAPTSEVTASLVSEARLVDHDAVIAGFSPAAVHGIDTSNSLLTIVSKEKREVADGGDDLEAATSSSTWSPLWPTGVGISELGAIGNALHRAGEKCLMIIHAPNHYRLESTETLIQNAAPEQIAAKGGSQVPMDGLSE